MNEYSLAWNKREDVRQKLKECQVLLGEILMDENGNAELTSEQEDNMSEALVEIIKIRRKI